jgi:hypothetical protein
LKPWRSTCFSSSCYSLQSVLPVSILEEKSQTWNVVSIGDSRWGEINFIIFCISSTSMSSEVCIQYLLYLRYLHVFQGLNKTSTVSQVSPRLPRFVFIIFCISSIFTSSTVCIQHLHLKYLHVFQRLYSTFLLSPHPPRTVFIILCIWNISTSSKTLYSIPSVPQVSPLAYKESIFVNPHTLILMMGAGYSSEISVFVNKSTQFHDPEDQNLNNRCVKTSQFI